MLRIFLVEAGNPRAVVRANGDLGERPDDTNLLNAIFPRLTRFKGGAGFLQPDALVGCCHIAENVVRISCARASVRSISELEDVSCRRSIASMKCFTQGREGEDPKNPPIRPLLEALAASGGTCLGGGNPLQVSPGIRLPLESPFCRPLKAQVMLPTNEFRANCLRPCMAGSSGHEQAVPVMAATPAQKQQ